MSSKKDAVFCRGPLVGVRFGEEGLDAVDFTVEEWGDALVVGLDGQRGEGGFGQDGGAEELGAGGDARAG